MSAQTLKPSNTAIKQQRLPVWRPNYTPRSVMPSFIIIGVIFIPVGIAAYLHSQSIQEKSIDYTNCTSVYDSSVTCADVIENSQNNGLLAKCTCKEKFELEENYKKDVLLYYGLSNFYQNHRTYVKSRDDNQLYGNLDNLTADCEPLAYFPDDARGDLPIAPCGAIANSIFNDTVILTYRDEKGEEVQVNLLKSNLAWSSDEVKFQNPPGPINDSGAFKNTHKPVDWLKPVYELDKNDSNNGYENEDLKVWMRTAALPNFRKLFRRIDHSEGVFSNSLPKGTYFLTIDYNFPVKSFDGTKEIILSNAWLLRSKNAFLGIAYIVVGVLSLIIACALLIVHILYGEPSETTFTDKNQL